LLINNFPKEHSENLIRELCDYFGKVTSVELIHDQNTKMFSGNAYVEFDSEFEAKKAFSSMMGLQVGSKVLYVKKL
jgi:RNA recognition motif-containing protein